MLLPIPNIFFVLSLALCTGYLTFLTTKGGLTNNTHPKIKLWKRLTTRGKIVFWILLIIATLLGVQEYSNEIVSSNKDDLLKRESGKRDSAITTGIKTGVDLSSKKLFADISEAFNKQGLRLDTVKKEVQRIRDSIKKSITVVNGSDPFFSLCKENPITLTNTQSDRYIFNLNMCNSSAPSRNISAKVYVVSIDSIGEMFFTKQFDLLQTNSQLDKEAQMTQQIIVPASKRFTICYFLLKGIWTNIDSSKSFKIDLIYHFNIETKDVGGVTALHEKQLRNFLKSKTDF